MLCAFDVNGRTACSSLIFLIICTMFSIVLCSSYSLVLTDRPCQASVLLAFPDKLSLREIMPKGDF